MLLKDKILVALDVAGIDDALCLVEQLKSFVGGFKVGLELCTSVGTSTVIEKVSETGGKLFLDLKFKDIPNTVAGAARAAARKGVFMFNVHCDGGAHMMQAAVEAARGSDNPPLVIGVTVLTSIDQKVLNDELRIPGPIAPQVVQLARLAKSAGLDGVVCSPLEIAEVKKVCGANFVCVVPGIRPAWAAAGDQRRVMTPAQAIEAGADYLVIGRPITSPPAEVGSPADAARRIVDEISGKCTTLL